MMANVERFVLTKGRRQIEVEIGLDGRSDVVACCLKTDSWEDFLAFKAEAIDASACADKKSMRRYLRAALVSLFGHVEGVVNEVFESHSIPRVEKGDSLSARAGNIALEAAKRGPVPPLDFTLGKYLRDVVAHPGITKAVKGRERDAVINECTVYEFLDLATVESLEAKLTVWLDAVCSAFDVHRFPGEYEIDMLVDGICDISGLTRANPSKSRTERSINPLQMETKILPDEENIDSP